MSKIVICEKANICDFTPCIHAISHEESPLHIHGCTKENCPQVDGEALCKEIIIKDWDE